MRILGRNRRGVQSHVVRLNVAEGPLQNSRRRRPGGLAAAGAVPDPEVTDKPKRRRFTVEYKLSLLTGHASETSRIRWALLGAGWLRQ